MGCKPQQNPTKIIEEIAQINDKKLARTTYRIQKKTEAIYATGGGFRDGIYP